MRWLLLLLTAAASQAEEEGSVRVTYRFPAPVIVRTKEHHRLGIPGLEAWAPAGAPALPRRVARILLPPGTTVAEISVREAPRVKLPGAFRLEPAPEEHSPTDGEPAEKKAPPDAFVYDSPGPYPPASWEYHGVAFKHGRAIAIVSLYPASWFPQSGEAALSSWMEVTVATRPLSGLEGSLPVTERAATRESLAGACDNPPPREPARKRGTGGGAGTADVAYAVITTAVLAPAFAPLAARRSAGGLPAQVFTMEFILSAYDGTRPDGGQDDATRVRNFIIDRYLNHGLRFVLLGGDADGSAACAECSPVVVPARRLQSSLLFTSAIPSDLYYGCLDGTFDGDADGLYGEPTDGPGGGDVDLLFEVQVGRAPVDTFDEARNFVTKTLRYEDLSGPVLREVLLVGEYLGFGGEYDWGGNLNDQIRHGASAGGTTEGFESGGSAYRGFFRVETLYDRDAANQDWPPAELIDHFDGGVHIVNHVGHADISSVMKLTNAEIDSLSNETPFLAYSQSCYAGAFDNQRTSGEFGTDSVVEHLLAGPAGAVAFIANSRRGWASTGTADGPSQRFNRWFWHAVLKQGVTRWGGANDRSKEENIAYIATNARARWCAYELNTLGDPALTIRLASPRGSLALDSDAYQTGDSALLTVVDSSLNVFPDEIDEAGVVVRSLAGADEETVTLTETAGTSSVFEGRIEITAGPRAAGTLQVSPPDTLVATYLDADTGSGAPATVEARARIAAPLRITSACPGSGAIGVPYSATLSASGGLPPYRFSSETGYVEEASATGFQGLGVGQNWNEDEGAWSYPLPFSFPFFGTSHETMVVSSNGYIQLGPGNPLEFDNTAEGLIRSSRIAPLWADLRTTGSGDIYITETPDSVTVRWRGTSYHTGGGVNFEAELSADGSIRFAYGSGNTDLSPTIGISAGDGQGFVLGSLNGSEDLSEAPPVAFFPTRLPDGLSVDAATGAVTGVPLEPAENEVAFRVEDSAGEVTRVRCFLPVRPDGLVVLSPAEGDAWLRGSVHAVRWQSFGTAGSNVRIDYNTDGSTTSFPLAIAASVPLNAREHSWVLPATAAARARVRVRSIERPDLFSLSGMFSIVPPTIFLRSPVGGERWAAGSQATVLWESIGDTGPRVRIRYNVDGAASTFPLSLTEDSPNTGTFSFTVPATTSEMCRLRVESTANPAIGSSSAGLFAIRSSSLTLTSPNGGECLRTGSTVQVTWSVQGSTGSQVIIEFNTNGGTSAFPLRVGGGPLPNTGTAAWVVPDTPAGRCRMRIRSASNAAIFDISDGDFRLDSRCSLRVLVWVPYIPVEEEQVLGIEQALARFEPDAALAFSTATTPLSLRSELAEKDAFIAPKQKRGEGIDFQALGSALGPILAEFAERGGAVVITAQTGSAEPFPRASGLLDATIRGEGLLLCEAANPLHPVLAGVRPNFAGPRNTAWYGVAGPGADLLVSTSEGDAVAAARDVGFGRATLLGFDYFSFNDVTSRILANAARVPLPAAGLRLVSPVPGSFFHAGEGLEIRWIARGEAQGAASLSYDPTGSGTSFPEAIAQAPATGDRGAYSWTAPPIPAGAPHLAIRLKAASVAAPAHADVLEEPIFVIRPLAIAPDALPAGSVGNPYSVELTAAGGVLPYSFEVDGLPPGLGLRTIDGTRAGIEGTPQSICDGCDVLVTVTDSIGLVARKSFPLSVAVRRITLLQPRGGELFLYGSTQVIRWTATGDVGATVDLHLSTDGSPSTFPFVIAEAVPIGGGDHEWTLPIIDAPRCRLRIESREAPQFFATSGEFSIQGPTIRLLAPRPGECWEPGRERKVLWQSVGNETLGIRIELSTDGSETEFPILIAQDAPDTGEYDWTVEDFPSGTCRVRVSFQAAPSIRDVSGGPFSISQECRLSGLIWSPGGISEDTERTLTEAIAAHEPSFEADSSIATGRDELAVALANKDALLVPLAATGVATDHSVLGQSVRPLLAEFVEDGGVVVLLGPNERTGRLLLGLGLVDSLRTVLLQPGLPCSVKSYLHPIVKDAPLRFTGPAATSAYNLLGGTFETLVEAFGRPVAVARDQGKGRWVLLGFSLEGREPASDRIIASATRMRPALPGLRVLSPEAGEVLLPGEPVEIAWAARGGRAGAVRIFYNRDGSTDIFPELAGESPGGADGGTFLWTAPAPQTGSIFSPSRIEVRWVDAPELPARSEGPFYLVGKRLSILTGALATGHQGANYRELVEVDGGVPPYAFDAGGLPSGLFVASLGGSSAAAEITGTPLGTGEAEVTVHVTDFLGSSSERGIAMTVLPSRIELISPAGGEHILAGSPFEVAWRVEGHAGETLRIEYNLDGSSRTFPYLAGEAPAGGARFSWSVPAGPTPAARVRIISAAPEIRLSAVSETTFAIERAGITCLSPNGAEALETGGTRTIRWRSLGNPGGSVRIDLSLDGSPDSFPVEVAAGVPDTGAFEWTVPASVSENCRIRVRSIGDGNLADASDGVFSIRYRTPVRGLVWVPHASFDEIEVRGAIAATTIFENDFDWSLSKALEPEDLASELVGKEAFLVVGQDPELQPPGGANFKVPGRRLGPVLRDFALRGGAVVILKQLGSARDFLPETGLLPASELGRGFDVPCRVLLPDHPVTNQVPVDFRSGTATAWYRAPAEAEVYAATAAGDAVVLGKDTGDGRVVLIGFDYRDYTPASARVIANAVRPARSVARPRFARGDASGDGFINISDAIFILDYLFRGGREPGCLDAADVDDSARPGLPLSPVGIGDPIRLLRWLFLGEDAIPPPVPPSHGPVGEACGVDPQLRDDLDCLDYPPCGE